jgi:cystatin-A/B
MVLPGGHSEALLATPQMQKIADQVKSDLEGMLGRGPFEEYELITFRQQVVAGMIYTFKIQISNTECVHTKVFQPLPHEQKGLEVQKYMICSLDDPLDLLCHGN